MVPEEANARMQAILKRMAEDDGKIAAYQIKQLFAEIEEVKVHIRNLETRAERRDEERAARERKNLIWGITFLGGVITTLIGVVWKYVILRGVE